jgi:hypothetical protein
MRRIALAVVLLFGGAVAAQADMDHWTSTQKQLRFDADTAVQTDADYCAQTVGPDLNGHPTPPAFKRCMASRGWRLSYTTRTKPEKTWIDPDTGLTCHDILGGLGSACSNF